MLPMMGNFLINMYATCRKLEESRRMFNIPPFHDGVACTSTVSLHVMHTVARHCLKEMEQRGMIV